MVTFLDSFMAEDVVEEELKPFEYEVIGLFLSSDDLCSVNDAMISGFYSAVYVMKKGYFFKLKQSYFKELKVIHENEIINAYPLITVGAYKKAEDESLIVTNEHELYVVYNNEVLGCDSTFAFEL